jgi:hypothetical protein
MPDATADPIARHLALQQAHESHPAGRSGVDEADHAVVQPEAVAPLSGAEAAAPAQPSPAPVVKFAIVGYTPTCLEAVPLLDDPEWEVWGMNNLHLQPTFADKAAKFDAWFDLHPVAEVKKDEPHVAWLARGADGVPVWTWDTHPDWPTTRAFPVHEVLARFPAYFTNTVSWQLAWALMRLMTHSPDGNRAPEGSTIAVFGIDMATGSEYAAQRPSVEYFLGLAAGLGVNVVLPERSDLLKSAVLYGEADTGMRAKLEERKGQLEAQHAEHVNAFNQHQAAIHALQGALEQVNYFIGVWFPPHVNKAAPENQTEQISQDGTAPPSTS